MPAVLLRVLSLGRFAAVGQLFWAKVKAGKKFALRNSSVGSALTCESF